MPTKTKHVVLVRASGGVLAAYVKDSPGEAYPFAESLAGMQMWGKDFSVQILVSELVAEIPVKRS